MWFLFFIMLSVFDMIHNNYLYNFRRCVVLLLLPQFFSKKGRQVLLGYAFILAITGPAKNTLHNMGILSESLACGQVNKNNLYCLQFNIHLKLQSIQTFFFEIYYRLTFWDFNVIHFDHYRNN